MKKKRINYETSTYQGSSKFTYVFLYCIFEENRPETVEPYSEKLKIGQLFAKLFTSSKAEGTMGNRTK